MLRRSNHPTRFRDMGMIRKIPMQKGQEKSQKQSQVQLRRNTILPERTTRNSSQSQTWTNWMSSRAFASEAEEMPWVHSHATCQNWPGSQGRIQRLRSQNGSSCMMLPQSTAQIQRQKYP